MAPVGGSAVRIFKAADRATALNCLSSEICLFNLLLAKHLVLSFRFDHVTRILKSYL